MIQNIEKLFVEKYGKQPVIVAAPGRVNLIGEHTDYNQGFVLPGAVDKKIYMAIAENGTNTINIFARQFNNSHSFSLDDIQPVKGWPTYLLGVTFYMLQAGATVRGMDVVIDGDIPVGAGMSSSAALCSAFGCAINTLFGNSFSRMQLALIGQKTEHHFAELQCGIMDQFASMHGKAGHVMRLDCSNLEFEYIPFDFPDYKIVLVNSMVSHSLASSEYNTRRFQCEEGVRVMQGWLKRDLKSLRDITVEELETYREKLDEEVYRRCSFILNENRRLLKGCEFLQNNDLEGFGQLMYQTHDGLSRWYEVSCPELDFLEEKARSFKGVAGSRMMGGGFGGCTINIVPNAVLGDFTDFMRDAYNREYAKTPEIYITQLDEGAGVVK
ncbi:MAG: galactokinase [Chitinophagaceae bacterium]|nr:MAG: galactokinase [Chitinophagaceae bacterium]